MKTYYVPVNVSASHVHLSRADIDILFGQGYRLHPLVSLEQPGQFAATETVTIRPNGSLKEKVLRVVGPERPQTQVEITTTQAKEFGIVPPPRRMSGDLSGSAGFTVYGKCWNRVPHEEGMIRAKRHIHMGVSQAAELGIYDGEEVVLDVGSVQFNHVIVRVAPGAVTEAHLDTDEANAAELTGKTIGVLINDRHLH